ncbi:MAG: four-carbon acid sugar kinase family protein [Mycobacterium sp.]
MIAENTDTHGPSAEHILAAAPPLRQEPAARERIRAANEAAGRRIAVLDDDPTGSQTVHDVSVVTVFEAEEYAAGLAAPGSTCFILTNTRSLSESAAIKVNAGVSASLFELGQSLGGPVEVVSRGDSTLRGHIIAEIRAIDATRRRVTGAGFDGVLLIPAYFEAGRFTAGDIHWATVAGTPTPVGDTEFAQDATFGYTSSNLRDFVAEKSDGTVTADAVHSITLDDIRIGGPSKVAEILGEVTGGAFVVVNATDYADLEIVVLGLLEVQEQGRSFGYRSGPSFVRALAGLEPQDPLSAQQIWPEGNPGGHGLVVVGSHVGLTSRQVARAQGRGGLVEAELHVPALIDADRRDAHVAEVGRAVIEALATSDVLLFTSRTLMRGGDADDSLAIARTVSTAVTDVVRASLTAHPAWVVAKGGITSHDVAVRGLGIRRAEVLGQLFPGIVSVFRPIEAAPEAVGIPYVVFAGNVGDDETLADVVDLFAGRR